MVCYKGKASKNDDWSDKDSDIELKLSDVDEEIVAPVKKNKKLPKLEKKIEFETDDDISEDEGRKKEKQPQKKKLISAEEDNITANKQESKKGTSNEYQIVTRSKKKAEDAIKESTSKDEKTKPKDKEEKNGDVIEELTEEVAALDIKTDGDTETKEEVNEKKLTHKEKKKLKKQQEYEKQMETMLKKGGQGHSELESNFTVSQAQRTAGQLAALENAVDIKVENFSISAKGKDLFVNANLLIANGRHYGLVGPNGYVFFKLLMMFYIKQFIPVMVKQRYYVI